MPASVYENFWSGEISMAKVELKNITKKFDGVVDDYAGTEYA